MTYTGTDHGKQATSYSRTASAATRRAKRDAHQAAECYATAGEARSYGSWVTQHPDLWGLGCAPAVLDARARSWTRTGDTYLRASWNATVSAEFYRELAGRYRALAARRAASMVG
jgi:hypothetical protein